MGFLGDVFTWFGDRAHWRGSTGVWVRLSEHIQLSLVCVVAAMALALPISVWLGHRRRFGTLAINVSNVGRALPSFAILAVGSQILGTRNVPVVQTWTTFLALVALAVPPLVTNAYVGVAEVPDDVRESARGMGLSDGQSLLRVELPMALPLIMAGVRTSAVQVVATATIAAVVGAGGLGRYIIDGFAVQDNVQVFAGAVLVAALSLLTEVFFSLVQRVVTPRGLRKEATLGPATDVTLALPSVEVA